MMTNLEDLRESFHQAGVLVAVHLYDVDEGNLGLGTVAEGFDYRSEFLDEYEDGYI